jgi:hypothetical protein
MNRVNSNGSVPEPPPEWELVVACARTRLLDSHKKKINSLINVRLNWAQFCTLVESHKLECVVYSNLVSSDLAAIPAEAAGKLETAARRRTQLGLMYTARLLELIKLFESEGLTPVPYKGPVLGVLAYQNFSLRSFQDLDFILPQEQLADAARVLIREGYRAYPDPTAAEQVSFLNRFHPGQYAFSCDAKPPQVELHTERTLRYLPIPLDWTGISKRLIQISVGGHNLRTFSIQDTLILLSVHGTKHFWERLSWICDIAELIQTPRGMDWELGHELAEAAGCRRMWLLGLQLATALLDAPLPENVQGWISSDATLQKLALAIHSRLVTGRGLPGAPERVLFRLRSYEKLGTGVSQCLRTATSPTEDDWHMCRLPDWASPLYFALRPWRLMREHGLGLRKKAHA